MKKILFSLAALAALSMVAVGCKKASDAAKAQPETLEQKRVREGRAVFAAFDKVLEAAKAAKPSSGKVEKVKADALHSMVEKYIAALALIENDCGSIKEVKENCNKLKGDALKTAAYKVDDQDNGDKLKAVYEEDSGTNGLKDSCELGKLKKVIDGIKSKAPYKS